MDIIRVNILKIQKKTSPTSTQQIFYFFLHISEALIYKKTLICDWLKDDVISGRIARLTQDHISHLYQKSPPIHSCPVEIEKNRQNLTVNFSWE